MRCVLVQTLTYLPPKPFLSGFPSLFQWHDIGLAVYISGMTQGLPYYIPDCPFFLTFFLPGHFYFVLLSDWMVCHFPAFSDLCFVFFVSILSKEQHLTDFGTRILALYSISTSTRRVSFGKLNNLLYLNLLISKMGVIERSAVPYLHSLGWMFQNLEFWGL